MNDVKYPEVRVKLNGSKRNSLCLIRKVTKALQDAGVSVEETDAFEEEALSGDYAHLLSTIASTVTIRQGGK